MPKQVRDARFAVHDCAVGIAERSEDPEDPVPRSRDDEAHRADLPPVRREDTGSAARWLHLDLDPRNDPDGPIKRRTADTLELIGARNGHAGAGAPPSSSLGGRDRA